MYSFCLHNFGKKPIEYRPIGKMDTLKGTKMGSTIQSVVEKESPKIAITSQGISANLESTQIASTLKGSSSSLDILEETKWIRSEEGITATLEGKNNNNTKTLEQDNFNNTEDNNNYNTEYNYTYAESDDNNTTTEGNSTNGESHDNLKDCLDNNDAYSRSDFLNLDNIKSDTVLRKQDLDIASKIKAKIDELISKLHDGNEPFDNMLDILIQFAILCFILLILFMLALGILSIIKNLWLQAKINYISKIQNTINYIKLDKAIANFMKLIELKDYYNKIKYIVKKFKNFDNRYKLVNLRSNNISSLDTNPTVNLISNNISFLDTNTPVNLIPNNISSFYRNITVNMNVIPYDIAPFHIDQQFTYSKVTDWPTKITNIKYWDAVYIRDNLTFLKNKYDTDHKYYDKLIEFLNKKCYPRTNEQKKNRIYEFPLIMINDQDWAKFNEYVTKKKYKIKKPRKW